MIKNLGPKSVIYPEPVLIIGTYDENGKANAMNAAWGGIGDTNELHLCISNSHKSTANLLSNKEFTVSMAVKEYAAECDYVGIVSANQVENKLEKTKFTTIKASYINAPIFEQLPFGLECKLKSYDPDTGHLYAEIVNCFVDDKIMTDDRIDLNKYHPIIYDGMNHNYYSFGEIVGQAFKMGEKLK